MFKSPENFVYYRKIFKPNFRPTTKLTCWRALMHRTLIFNQNFNNCTKRAEFTALPASQVKQFVMRYF